jgi:glycosyltransferase involved in cell wall biosynthesis
VLTCDNSSLPEVAGDAALLTRADDVGGLADALECIIHDDAMRARLRAAGPPRARQFAWERAAHDVLALYERVSS